MCVWLCRVASYICYIHVVFINEFFSFAIHLVFMFIEPFQSLLRVYGFSPSSRCKLPLHSSHFYSYVMSCDDITSEASLLLLHPEIEFLCAVATADLLLCTPPDMAALAAGRCSCDTPSYILSVFAPPSRSCVFLSQLLPMLHAEEVSLASVAVPVLVSIIISLFSATRSILRFDRRHHHNSTLNHLKRISFLLFCSVHVLSVESWRLKPVAQCCRKSSRVISSKPTLPR
jgi:hypothetical protein